VSHHLIQKTIKVKTDILCKKKLPLVLVLQIESELVMHLVHLKVQLDSLVHNIKNDLIHSIIDKITSNMLHPRHSNKGLDLHHNMRVKRCMAGPRHQINLITKNLSINQIREYLQLQERLRLNYENYDIVRHQIIHTGNLVALEFPQIWILITILYKDKYAKILIFL